MIARSPIIFAILGLCTAVCVHLIASGGLAVDLTRFWGAEPDISDIVFWNASLPRLAMALLVGMGMGSAGALLQEVTQNRLIAPTTMGTASGLGWHLLPHQVLPQFSMRQHLSWFQ